MFHSRPARKVRAYRPHLEVLEDRTLLSTYLVDHLADDMVGTGTSGSLRYAITHAMDGDTITFGVTGTINLNGALPNLTHNFSRRASMLASYVWSHTIDNVDPDAPGGNPNDPNFAGRARYCAPPPPRRSPADP